MSFIKREKNQAVAAAAAATAAIWAQESIWRVAMMALELAALAGLIRPS